MNKDLTIIIPTYNDTLDKIKYTLDSIVKQKDYDFTKLEILIVDDCSDNNLIDWMEVLKNYPTLDIKYTRLKENKGPGIARQMGLDLSKGEFIYFLDSGDALYDSTVLKIFGQKKVSSHDLISTRFYDEEIKSKRISFVFNNAYIFGIFIKKDFLLEHNIRFSEVLRWEEDAYFEDLIRYYKPNVLSLRNISYYYKADVNSITRKNDYEYRNDFAGFSAMVVKSILLCNFYKEENAYLELINEMFRILVGCYVRFYPYLFGDLEVTDRINRILYLLKLLGEKCNLNTKCAEFRRLFIEKAYERKVLYNNTVPYDKIDQYMDLIYSSENIYGGYKLEGTNVTIDELRDCLLINENSVVKRS